MKTFPGSINAFLGNSARGDLIGPEMWTVSDVERIPGNIPDSMFESAISPQLPHYAWGPPRMGLAGIWCLGHQTNLKDVLQLVISRVDGAEREALDFVATRNHWTPAYMTTYYRARASRKPGEHPYAGPLTVRESKCITEENVFVSEVTLTNDQRRPRDYRVEIRLPHFQPGGQPGAFAVQVETVPRGLSERLPIQTFAALVTSRGGPDLVFRLGPFQSATFQYAFCVDADPSAALQTATAHLRAGGWSERNASAFDRWFDELVPRLVTADQDMLKAYYYRWFVVKRNRHNPGKVIRNHPYPRPAFYESPMGSWFGCVIGLSVPFHIQESQWLRDPSYARDEILNWADAVRGYRTYIQFTPMAIWDRCRMNPDPDLLARVYPAIKAYTLDGVQGLAPDDLPVQKGSWMTGAEYQPNFYQFTDPSWDWRHDLEGARQQGYTVAEVLRLDLAAYTIANLTACARTAAQLGHIADAASFEQLAGRKLATLKKEMWDESHGMFYAADPATRRLANQAACYDSFAPFLWGLAGEPEYLRAFERFFDPAWFWSDFPIATVAKTCPMYWPGNCLTGPTAASEAEPHPYDCAWNGPVWHYANGLMAEALGAAAASEHGKPLRDRWIEFMASWTRLHFLYGDRSVPCAIEHNRAADGARFRSICDYFHSAWIDPFMKYWAGIRLDPASGALTFEPYTTEEFELRGVVIQDRTLTFIQRREGPTLSRSITPYDES